MVVFPNAKINLGLRILRKRPDGYHDLETIFYPIPLNDVLEIIQHPSATTFHASGLTIDGDPLSNLCMKAYELVKKDYPALPHVQLYLHKIIPSGAGLGGGSADASFTLQLLNRLLNGVIDDETLHRYALQLGSDCPFFLENKPCLATGRGELLQPINISLKGYAIVLINPRIHISTKEAFAQLKPTEQSTSLRNLITQPISTWRDHIINDFETPVFLRHPDIASIKDTLYQSGALYASMSGSGSSVFGIFHEQQIPAFRFPSNYFISTLIGQAQ